MRVVMYIIYLIIFCSLLYTIQVFLFFHRLTDIKPILFMSSLLFMICFLYDTGTELNSHGGYNRIILFLFIFFFAGVFFLIIFTIYFMKKRLLTTLLVVLTISLLLCLKLKNMVKCSCEDWEYGFKGSKIQNLEDTKCKIHPPKVCYHTMLNKIFDLSRLLHDTCENMPTNKLFNNQKYLTDQSTKIIGYPRTENWAIFPSSTHSMMNKKVMKEIINMEDKNIDQRIKDNIEVTTNFYKNPPEVNINLKRNEELVKERAKLFEKYKKGVLAKNVIYLFIDSLSRVNFKLKLPKFWDWIGKFYNNDLEKSNEKIESFQFFKYHGVGRYTGVNMVPAFFGVYNIYYAGNHFVTNYKKTGYITGQSLNFCGREVFDIDSGAIEHMKWGTFDHEMQSFFCDGNFTPYDGSYPLMMGTNSIRKRCMYNKNTTWYSLEYLRQFFTKYSDSPKLFRVGLVDGHEGTTEVIKYSDDLLVEFFEKFRQDGFLDDAVLIIHSDHGNAMPGPFTLMEFEDHEYEAVLPAYFIIAPKSMKYFPKIRENLKHNENALFTPFTTYNTLNAILGNRDDILFSMEDHRDLFSKKISKMRHCKNTFWNADYFYGKEFICRCSE